MQTEETYRPANIEFDVVTDETIMPENFGRYENAEDAAKFMGGNLIISNHGITVNRHMDHVEKKLLRKQYEDVLENILPINEKKLSVATSEANEAKKKEKEAQEMVNASMSEVKQLAFEVKRGLKEMRLDENYTFKIPFRGRFYFYTYIDNHVRLVKINDIPEHEKGEIFNSSASNEEFMENNFGMKNESVAT